VCELAPAEAPFPRRQMLWAQWGLVDRLAADPGVWLCHQCNECNVRCPRDAKPGDVLQSLRSMAVQHLAFPGIFGKLVGNVRATWPLLVALPLVFWIVLLGVTTGLHFPHVEDLPALEGLYHYESFVPHVHIYVVYTAAALWVTLACLVSGRRLWRLMGEHGHRDRGFLAALLKPLLEIASHKRFDTCGPDASQRRWGHFLVLWGFVGAAVTSGLLIFYLYKDTPFFSWMPLPMPHDYPLPLHHPVKWLGNISAVALVIGGLLLFMNRLKKDDPKVGATTAFDRFFLWIVLAVIVTKVGATTAFDRFFLWIVLAVIVTGVFTEVLRFIAPPVAGCVVYLLHLSVVLTLFLTFPYSKFAHLLYRTLAMVHQQASAEGDSK
jgi:quinone-modifying oxidoreductase subunit QmoC